MFIKRPFPFYAQTNAMDCGPACLKMIARYHGKNISISDIRSKSLASRAGTSLFQLGAASEHFGMKAGMYKLTLNQLLRGVDQPGILLFNDNHYVVFLRKVGNKRIRIADPAVGVFNIEIEEFSQKWLVQNEKGICLLLEPTFKFYSQEEESDAKLNWRLIRKQLTGDRKQISFLVLGLFLSSLFQFTLPFITQSIVDIGVSSHNLTFIKVMLVAQLTLLLSQTVVDLIRSRIQLYISSRLNMSLLSDFWSKLMRLPISFFDSRNSGDILQRIVDHRRLDTFITSTALQVIFSGLSIVLFSIILLHYSGLIYLIFLIGSIMYFLWVISFMKRQSVLDNSSFNLASLENSMTMQLINGMHEIKINGVERAKRELWDDIQTKGYFLNYKILSLNQFQTIGGFFINHGKNLIITFLVSKLVLDGSLSFGSMLAIQYVIGQISSPLEQIIQFIQSFQYATLSMNRLNEIRSVADEEPAEIHMDKIDSIPVDSISFKNISFNYPAFPDNQVLSNIDVVFPHGQVTAIVGKSGSGKTSILKLILMYYQSYQGTIKLGSSDFTNIPPHAWRSRIGCVLQDGFIFSDSIANNIALDNNEIDYARLEQACKLASILDFINGLPQKFKTTIGSEGLGLSVGQRQRILIARVIYKNPQLILLDEATNALDATNERTILDNLNSFFIGKTVIIVAHRLSTVKNADNIVVLDGGRIVEQGTHLELASRKGAYYTLVQNQLELGL